MKFSSITHYLAVAAVLAVGFLESPAGQALARQYPHIEPIAGLLTTVLALYHVPLAK